MRTPPLEPIEFTDPTSPAIAGRILARCHRDGVVWVRAPASIGGETTFWDERLQLHGRRVPVDEDPITGVAGDGLWSTVAYDPAHPDTFRHSNTAQPLHTDGSYVAEPPEIVFLVCRRPARQGGATLFLDGHDLVRLLGMRQPSLLTALVHHRVGFAKGGSRVDEPVITLARDGPRLRWNYFALAADQAPGARQVAEDFRAFLADGAGALPLRSVTLAAGDAVFFRDDRVLHGRDGFSADEPDGRFLWKGGLRSRTAADASR